MRRQTLSKQAQWLNQYGNYAITIEGHADERGTREYNLALGARRAAATRDFLIARGVAAKRMKTISYGKERPVAVCDDISCWCAEPPRGHRAQRCRQLSGSARSAAARPPFTRGGRCGRLFRLRTACKQNLAEVCGPDKASIRARIARPPSIRNERSDEFPIHH